MRISSNKTNEPKINSSYLLFSSHFSSLPLCVDSGTYLLISSCEKLSTECSLPDKVPRVCLGTGNVVVELEGRLSSKLLVEGENPKEQHKKKGSFQESFHVFLCLPKVINNSIIGKTLFRTYNVQEINQNVLRFKKIDYNCIVKHLPT